MHNLSNSLVVLYGALLSAVVLCTPGDLAAQDNLPLDPLGEPFAVQLCPCDCSANCMHERTKNTVIEGDCEYAISLLGVVKNWLFGIKIKTPLDALNNGYKITKWERHVRFAYAKCKCKKKKVTTGALYIAGRKYSIRLIKPITGGAITESLKLGVEASDKGAKVSIDPGASTFNWSAYWQVYKPDIKTKVCHAGKQAFIDLPPGTYYTTVATQPGGTIKFNQPGRIVLDT